jgi:ClpP class serine protease
MVQRTSRFPFTSGIIAAPPKVWGMDYLVLASQPNSFEEMGDYAVVCISGPLMQHCHPCFDNYDDIRGRFDAALESSKDNICLCINSPGGDFSGSIELSHYMREACKKKGKTLTAFTDSQMSSAAYAIGCAADKIVVTPSGFVGSIGVWAALCDTTAMDKALGQNIIIVASGAHKADKNPHVPITDSAVESLKTQVDGLASLFFSLVSMRRNLSLDAVTSFEGAECYGQNAVNDGLADMVVNSFSEWVSTSITNNSESNMSKYDEALGAMRRASEGDDDDAKKAKKALQAMKVMDEEKKDDKEEKEEDKKASASSEEDKKEEKKDSSMKMKKAEAYNKEEKEEKAAAAAVTAQMLELTKELHTLKASIAAEKDSLEREGLFSQRPDFSNEVVASLQKASTDFLRVAVQTWPKINRNSSAATFPSATRGESQKNTDESNPAFIGSSEEDFINEKMGLKALVGGVKQSKGGREMELGYMSPAEVAAAVAKLDKKEAV